MFSAFRIRSGRQDVNPFSLVRQSNNIRKADTNPINRQMFYAYRLDEMKFTLDEVMTTNEWGQLMARPPKVRAALE
jgi:hypothetical protein